MRFSVLVPVYNVEEYLENCIKSILNQTYQDFELILVDDGSTDKSGRICDEFVRLYPEKIKVVHKINQGLISARREGIRIASGEFCVFVDSDDFVELNLLESINSYLKKEIDLALYSYSYVRNKNKEYRGKTIAQDGQIWSEESKKDLYQRISYTSDITSIWTKAIRTNILKSDPTDYEKYYKKNMAEDLLQSLYPLTAAKKIVYIDKELYNYRVNETSISHSFHPETIEQKNTLHVYEKILEYLPVWQLDCEEVRDQIYAKWFNETMYMLSKYYEAAGNKQDKKIILSFNWESFLPEDKFQEDNVYINEDYKKLYKMWKKQKLKEIQRYFFRKKCYQTIKHMKRKLIK